MKCIMFANVTGLKGFFFISIIKYLRPKYKDTIEKHAETINSMQKPSPMDTTWY